MTVQRCGDCRYYDAPGVPQGACQVFIVHPVPWWLPEPEHRVAADAGRHCELWEPAPGSPDAT